MLKALFEWLDSHPRFFWVPAGLATLLLALRVLAAFRLDRQGGPIGSTRSKAWDALALFLFLLGWRWPFLLSASDYNPDESQLIAGAITLVRDPVFWRSVDGTTSGPLNFYVLLPLHWIGAPLDFFSVRLLGLAMLAVALFACHRLLTRSYDCAVAWLGVLPAAGFFATVTHPDLIHFSSERLTLMLVAVAAWLLAARQPREQLRLWAACAIAGTIPWAKLQGAPLSVVLVGWGLWQIAREPSAPAATKIRRATGAIFAALAPTLVAAGLIAANGQVDTALRRYFFHNLTYVGFARPLGEALREMTKLAVLDGRMPLLLGTGLVFLTAAIAWHAFRRARPTELFVAGGILTAAAVLAILTPRREYLHYTLLLPIPLTIWMGAGIAGWWTSMDSRRARVIFSWVVVLAGALPMVVTRCFQPVPEMIGLLADHWRHPRTAASVIIRELAGSGGTLGIWGWANHLYVETGLPQATRDAHSVWSIIANDLREYHRTIYLEDLRRNQPAVFVDAVGSDAFGFTERPAQGHETFPELARYIAENYTLVVDLGDARIYARNELQVSSRLPAGRLDQLIARGRLRTRVSGAPPALTSLDHWPRKFVGGREVLMLLPPAKIEWQLDGDVRQVALEFGFDPVAYEQGKSNGAELILELVDAERTREIFHRVVDPNRNPADRGRLQADLILPPFSSHTRLVLRSTPGENNDNAWDWLYLATLRFERAPRFLPEQFPGFNRVPDSADAPNSLLARDGKAGELLMHAPSAVTYLLTGKERRLHFEYGFKPGAYTNGGNTDGAIFRLEQVRPGQPVEVLFERHLQPVSQSADRGLQQADVILPANLAGTRLTLRIDPGPAGNAAWDWTYVSKLLLEDR